MTKLRWILAPLAAGLLALTMACGGDDDNSQGNDGGSASGGGGAVSQELNLAQAATQLAELRSFRFDLSFNLEFDLGDLEDIDLEDPDSEDAFGAAFAAAFLALFSDIKMEGAYVAPDSFDMQMSIAGENVHYIQIGAEAWVDDGTGWVVTEPDGGELSFLGDPTSFATDMLPDAVLQNADISEEDVNGVPALKYHFDKESLQAVATELGEDVTDFEEIDEMELDVWIIDGNIPVKFEIKVSGTDADGLGLGLEARFEIKDINADISIDRPIP
jgi:hypothetical protein